jgi:hypothetical protein
MGPHSEGSRKYENLPAAEIAYGEAVSHARRNPTGDVREVYLHDLQESITLRSYNP